MPKIASIRNLPAASDKGSYFVESFASKFVNGARVLSPTFSFVSSINNTQTGFSNLDTLTGMVSMILGSDATISSIVGIATDSRIYHYAHLSGTSRGEIHSNTNGGSNLDLFVTDKENLLFSGSTYLGIGLRIVCKTGSGSTKIVDTDGRNFTTLGISSSAGHNKVYNITQGVEYTVSSISTTNSTNDTINLSSGTPAVGDYCIAFNDSGFNLFTTTAYPQYNSQKTQSTIIHQIRQFDTDYLVTNGNWLASLNVNESTWNDNYKQLPNNTEATCFAINQGQILIGASYKGKGRLLLWNGFSDGFLSIVEVEQLPQAIEAFNNGWMVVIGANVYFTTGYQMQKIATLPDADYFGASCTVLFNGMKIIDQRIYINADLAGTNRAKSGTWVYDLQGGWTYVPSLTSSGVFLTGQTMGAVQSVVSNNQNRLFCSYAGLNPAPSSDTAFIGRLSDQTGYLPSAILMIPLSREMNIKGVEISLGIKNVGSRSSGSATTAVVHVAMGDARRALFRAFTSGTSNTTTTIKNTSAANYGAEGIVGQQIRIQKGAAAGERSYITSIASAGTSSEVLTISPALSAAPSDSQIVLMMNLKDFGSKTITNIALPEAGQLRFESGGGIFTDKVFVEVSVTGTDADLIEINGIDLYE